MIYRVINKQTQEEVTRYAAAQLVELPQFPLSDYDYVEFVPDAPAQPQTVQVWTPLEFLRRFTQAERVAIRDAAKASTVIEDYLKILEITTEVRSDDPDVSSSLALLEQNGLIAAGRAQEILNG